MTLSVDEIDENWYTIFHQLEGLLGPISTYRGAGEINRELESVDTFSPTFDVNERTMTATLQEASWWVIRTDMEPVGLLPRNEGLHAPNELPVIRSIAELEKYAQNSTTTDVMTLTIHTRPL
jgi:hypothetical protein